MSHGIVTPGATFAERSRAALADPELQGALTNLHRRLDTARAAGPARHRPLAANRLTSRRPSAGARMGQLPPGRLDPLAGEGVRDGPG